MTHSHKTVLLYAVLAAAVAVNVAFWTSSRSIRAKWDNVPAAPSHAGASMGALGDDEIAYRLIGYFLQSSGNVGGRYESLKNYDYAKLEDWFFLTQKLDERANYVPFLAAFYFGSVEDAPDKSVHIARYLGDHGALPYDQKWRWLAQAVYQARFKMNDLPLALDYAHRLAALKTDTAPWARQMPAFIEMKMGNKQAAYEIMMRMLVTEKDKLPANEINAMRDYICTRTAEEARADENPLCQETP